MEIIQSIQDRIYDLRGERVMLDFDLAALYEAETKVLNQAVKRNAKRFADDFIFQLTAEAFSFIRNLPLPVDNQYFQRSQIVTLNIYSYIMQRTFSFNKTTAKEWYVDLPEWKGDKSELQMVEGADIMLDLLSNNTASVDLEMNDEEFADADQLTLIHAREENLGGGGDYLLETYNGNAINQKMWLCAVTEFVFEKLPQKIWFRKV